MILPIVKYIPYLTLPYLTLPYTLYQDTLLRRFITRYLKTRTSRPVSGTTADSDICDLKKPSYLKQLFTVLIDFFIITSHSSYLHAFSFSSTYSSILSYSSNPIIHLLHNPISTSTCFSISSIYYGDFRANPLDRNRLPYLAVLNIPFTLARRIQLFFKTKRGKQSNTI